MNRREFLGASALASGLALGADAFALEPVGGNSKGHRGTFSIDNNRISIYTPKEIKTTRIFHITDTHLSIDDERGAPYTQYSGRMAAAYQQNMHFKTGENCTAPEAFEQSLAIAKDKGVDFLALTGDLFSFPSEAAVDWVLEKLNAVDIPYAFVAGNHDWHYEGMKGSSEELRDTWIKNHLLPMYQGNNPLYAAYDVNGIRFVCIDNSTYEILPEQLEFFREQRKAELPMILLIHIPLYMPGRPMGFGCGNPYWGEKSDRNFKIERREKWRKGGHTKTTFDFCQEVFEASNLLSILTGHIHKQSLDIMNGIPQFVSGHNATGYYGDVKVKTMS